MNVMFEGLLTMEEFILEHDCKEVCSSAHGYSKKEILNFERKFINYNLSIGVEKFILRINFMSRIA